MRYLLLILICSVSCLAQDDELQKIFQEAMSARVEFDHKEASQLVTYRNNHFHKIPEVKLGVDPKQSEVKLSQLVSEYNNTYNHVDEIASQKDGAWNKFDYIYTNIKKLDESALKLKELGIDPHTGTAPAIVNEQPGADSKAKPREKKKITATLSDGTKID